MIRTILCIPLAIILLLISIPVLIVEKIIAKFNRRVSDISTTRFVQKALSLFLYAAGVRLTVIGKENIPRDQAVLYVGNHQSMIDPLVAYTVLPGPTGIISKMEVAKIPLVAAWMRQLHCLFLDRSDLRQGMKTILAAIDQVKDGISILIYPEGTRNKNEDETELLEFHEGSYKIAIRSGCPIVPIAISGTAKVVENQFPKLRKGQVILEFGKPIDPKALSRDEQKCLGVYSRGLIGRMLLEQKGIPVD